MLEPGEFQNKDKLCHGWESNEKKDKVELTVALIVIRKLKKRVRVIYRKREAKRCKK